MVGATEIPLPWPMRSDLRPEAAEQYPLLFPTSSCCDFLLLACFRTHHHAILLGRANTYLYLAFCPVADID